MQISILAVSVTHSAILRLDRSTFLLALVYYFIESQDSIQISVPSVTHYSIEYHYWIQISLPAVTHYPIKCHCRMLTSLTALTHYSIKCNDSVQISLLAVTHYPTKCHTGHNLHYGCGLLSNKLSRKGQVCGNRLKNFQGRQPPLTTVSRATGRHLLLFLERTSTTVANGFCT